MKRTAVLVGAAALVAGISLPAQAQSVTVCVELHANIAGTPVDQPQTCVTLPPAAP